MQIKILWVAKYVCAAFNANTFVKFIALAAAAILFYYTLLHPHPS